MTYLYKKEQDLEIRLLRARVEKAFDIINKLFFGFVLLGLIVLIGGMMPFFFSPGMSGLGYTLIAALILIPIFLVAILLTLVLGFVCYPQS